MYDIGKISLNLITCKDSEVKNKIIASQFFDKKTIENKEFSHCYFSNISFKNSILQNLIFINCRFFDCYFKETIFSNCEFTGCKFIDCNFRKTQHALENTKNIFAYSSFKNCYLKYEFMLKCLPEEPNISKEIIQNLEDESYKSGSYDEYLKYKYKRIHINENHLKSAFLRKEDWYKKNFNKSESYISGLKFLYSKMEGLIWGYGEKLLNLIISFLLVNIVLFSVIFWFFYNYTFYKAIYLSFQVIFSVNGTNIIKPDESSLLFFILVQKIISILFIALFVSLFMRRVLKK